MAEIQCCASSTLQMTFLISHCVHVRSVATCSPSVMSVEETLSTLNYAQRAHGITNKPVSSLKCLTSAGGDPSAGGEGVNVDTFRQVRVRSFVFHTHVQQIDSTLPESHPACAQLFRCLCLRCQRCKNPSDGDSIEVHGSSSG